MLVTSLEKANYSPFTLSAKWRQVKGHDLVIYLPDKVGSQINPNQTAHTSSKSGHCSLWTG